MILTSTCYRVPLRLKFWNPVDKAERRAILQTAVLHMCLDIVAIGSYHCRHGGFIREVFTIGSCAETLSKNKKKDMLKNEAKSKSAPKREKTATSENVSQGMVSSLVKWWNSGAAKFKKVKLMHCSTITIDRVSCPMIPGHRTPGSYSE